MRRRPATLPLVCLLALAVQLAAAPMATAQPPAGDKVLRIDFGGFPDTLEPQQNDIGQGSITALAFEGLTRLDEKLNLVPAAAESWAFSADGLALTFRLRDHLLYSDGSPLTADRFRYAIERACDPHTNLFSVSDLFAIVGCKALNTSMQSAASPSAGESAYAAAKAGLGVRALDDRTLEIRLTAPTPRFPLIAAGPGFLPVKQELVEAGGPQWWLDPANWVGNGPFRLASINRDTTSSRIRFVPNEHYWAGRARLDGIEYVVIDHSLDAYKRGDLDIFALTSDLMPQLEADPVLSRQLVTAPATYTGVFLMNLTREPFTDKRVREAFAYAFDRDAYCREVEFATCTPTLSWIPPGVPGAIETDAYAFDPEKARQALAASSYGGPDKLPEIRWYYLTDDAWSHQMAQWVADQYRQVLGVRLVLIPVTEEQSNAMFGVDSETWPQFGSFFYYSELPDPHDWLAYWTCGEKSFAVYIGYCNPAYDALVAQVDREADATKRLALAEEAQRVLIADAPSIFVYNPTSVWLVKPYVVGYSRVAPQQQWPGWWNPLAVDIDRPS